MPNCDDCVCFVVEHQQHAIVTINSGWWLNTQNTYRCTHSTPTKRDVGIPSKQPIPSHSNTPFTHIYTKRVRVRQRYSKHTLTPLTLILNNHNKTYETNHTIFLNSTACLWSGRWGYHSAVKTHAACDMVTHSRWYATRALFKTVVQSLVAFITIASSVRSLIDRPQQRNLEYIFTFHTKPFDRKHDAVIPPWRSGIWLFSHTTPRSKSTCELLTHIAFAAHITSSHHIL